MTAQQLPRTAGSRTYRAMLAILGVVLVPVMWTTVQSLIARITTLSVEPTRQGWIYAAASTMMIIHGCLILWVIIRGLFRNIFPSERVLFAMLSLVWATIVLQRF